MCVGRTNNLYLIYFCIVADLLKPGLSWKIQLKSENIYTYAMSYCSGLNKVTFMIAQSCSNNV